MTLTLVSSACDWSGVLNDVGLRIPSSHNFAARCKLCRCIGLPNASFAIADIHKPWVLSNIVDTTTNRVPESLREFLVLERRGLRIGIVGLVERYALIETLHLDY